LGEKRRKREKPVGRSNRKFGSSKRDGWGGVGRRRGCRIDLNATKGYLRNIEFHQVLITTKEGWGGGPKKEPALFATPQKKQKLKKKVLKEKGEKITHNW